ncbi:D-alanyl-D-alanine carboxypeptidase family protein [Streptococcus sp. zg-86]|uniref:D-alanyl-D-alanine carboxypeptidase family protein n=2 Tax=Streptococcus TaxID=1301 RepID=A0A6I4RFU5_9STRE|nr:D-alanyl-D-alanine carboxypeptidase family protein [Streptococcus sp. zg-86]MTB90046.1 D-alanyl-D-alanine carboxypeptidase family protein [Streptococcus sp. zg-36]MWV55717.1 D-alanyl-D-alanine carboxypeptidase family protein [Streptococcus sp. zg-70]
MICLLVILAGVIFVWKIDTAAFFQGATPTRSSSATSISAASSSSQAQKEDTLPNVSPDDWELVLVNRDHLLETEPASLTSIGDIQVDSRIAEATNQFLVAARMIVPEEILISGYRSKTEQEQLYNDRIAEAEASGLSQEEAENLVKNQVQRPGASEHQTGLAIDMGEAEGQLDEVAEKIKALAPQYGFVLRYPEGKSEITGIKFESWHFRYVGIDSAKYMEEHHLVLEEYIALLKEKKQ